MIYSQILSTKIEYFHSLLAIDSGLALDWHNCGPHWGSSEDLVPPGSAMLISAGRVSANYLSCVEMIRLHVSWYDKTGRAGDIIGLFYIITYDVCYEISRILLR